MAIDKVSQLLLFGATGDLSRRMLLPALYGLDAEGLLPADLSIVATARSEMDHAAFRASAIAALAEHVPADFFDPAKADAFVNRFTYVALDATQPAGFARLAVTINPAKGLAIFLSTAPALFKATIAGLVAAGLTGDRVRLALEKPLGSDLASSREINDAVAAAFPEERTFRIDHYLGKETVQNLLALRFANSLFEPLWNSAHIDHVQISVAETIGIAGRGDYYDGAGALRDMVQNHMLQLLALVAMEPPADFDATSVRDEKVKVLRSLRPIRADEVADRAVTGQYRSGAVDGAPVKGYADELGRPSDTETFVALKAHVDNWRWAGVPFYLRTGKRMADGLAEIVVRFKQIPHSIFNQPTSSFQPNSLVIRLQPDEGLRMNLMAKTPGEGMRLKPAELELDFRETFNVPRMDAYERLLLDVLRGQLTLFMRGDELEAAWEWVEPILNNWEQDDTAPLPYTSGTWGPAAASALIGRDGLQWREEALPED